MPEYDQQPISVNAFENQLRHFLARKQTAASTKH